MSNIFRLARETLFGNAVQEKAKKEAAIDELRTSPGIDEHQIDERHLLHKYGCRINDGPDADHVRTFFDICCRIRLFEIPLVSKKSIPFDSSGQTALWKIIVY